MNNAEGNQEIIIVRRGKGGDDGHHGGAWKIAFADFMTAMMALFLVLWLVNAASEDSKKSIASYFNPIKLADKKKAPRGLHPSDNNADAKKSEDAKEENGVPKPERSNEGGQTETPITDESFFADPEKALDAIAATAVAPNEEVQPSPELFMTNEEIPAPDSGAVPEFIDPFSPTAWASRDATEEEQLLIDETQPDKQLDRIFDMNTAALDENIIDPEIEGAPSEAVEEKPAFEMQDEAEIAQAEEEPDVEEVESASENLAKELAGELGQAFEMVGISVEQFSITERQGAVLISLADNLDFSMFGVGSAVPSKELVDAVAILGRSLSEKNTTMEIVGHTDGRPYARDDYDNWQLSSARAQAALYMLIRGGVKENRISSVSGKADRELKNPADPFAAENRRIDILVRLDET